MIPLLILVGLVLLGLPGLGSRGSGHPAHWARWSLSTLVTGFLLVEAGLLLWTAPAALDLMGATDLAHICRRMLGGLVPPGWSAGAVSGAAAVVLAGTAIRGAWRVRATQRRMRVGPLVGVHSHMPGHDLVVLPVSEVIAYAVRGRRPQVVVSEGLVEAVGPAGVEAVCAHESVHVRHRHDGYLTLLAGVAAAFRWYPLVARSQTMTRLALERWADEEAGRVHRDGRDGIKGALLTAAFTAVGPGTAAFGAADTVAARVRALAEPPPSTAWGLVLVGYIAVVLAAGASAGWLGWAARMSFLAVTNPSLCVF